MPLPIAHTSAGIFIYLSGTNTNLASQKKEKILFLIFCIVLANLTDLDFLPGILLGTPGRFHHGLSHSLLVSFSLGLVFFLYIKRKVKFLSKWRVFSCTVLSLISHPLLDYFSIDTSSPYGVPLFWPFSSSYYISPLPLFRDVQRSEASVKVFLTTLINSNNGIELAVECLFSGMILFGLSGFLNRLKLATSISFFAASILCGILYYFIQIKPFILA